MPLEKKKIRKSLIKKGFSDYQNNHKRFVYITLAGKKTTAKTMLSHGSDKEIGDDLITQMKKQCKLDTKAQFYDLIECPLTQEQYEAILIEKGYCS